MGAAIIVVMIIMALLTVGMVTIFEVQRVELEEQIAACALQDHLLEVHGELTGTVSTSPATLFWMQEWRR
jgi:hypothetical protein